MVKLAFKGAKRLAESKTSYRKEPFIIEILNDLVERYGTSQNLIHLRFLLIAILGFAGFFRTSELLNLKVKHLNEKVNSFEIFLEKSKTDQLRERNIVYIAKTSSTTCPVLWLRKYLALTNLKSQP
ncbi:integrase/recombinase xerD homolog [Hydractinia symbiolongicarpus]|uniref:integrase/recombinase xerD homolog n=1 Tax=Hydractinia symbiolongicarpus TaxID=13093 RepID=UPI00254D9907|nr:integrase/recombinase xerD homolog [Hydractinia symbiolongicarpus]